MDEGDAGDHRRLALAREYLGLVAAHPTPLPCVLFHLRRICKGLLGRYQAMDELLAAPGTKEAAAVLQRCEDYLNGTKPFRPDAAAAAREQEVAARRKREAEKRKEFESRMRRKAKREGHDEDHYLKHGLAPPAADEVAKARALPAAERLTWWKAHFGQHCVAFHVEGKCAREASGKGGCAFLHLEVAGAAEDNPSWLEEDLATRLG